MLKWDMPSPFSIIEAPSPLGLWPSGVQDAPRVLLEMGLGIGLAVTETTLVPPPPYDPRRDSETHLLNPKSLIAYGRDLAAAVDKVKNAGAFPIVLGGDCSILIGPALALKRRGTYGLLFIDGHMDYWDAAREPFGEAASMDLALVTGAGPAAVANIDGLGPYFAPEHCVAYGTRDHLHDKDFIETPYPVALKRIDIEAVHSLGQRSIPEALACVTQPHLDGFWIHLDADVLNDDIMPAVDYRMKDGLSWDELSDLLAAALATGKTAGITLTIYNPNLDPSRSIARTLVARLVRALKNSQ
jgi:arginase